MNNSRQKKNDFQMIQDGNEKKLASNKIAQNANYGNHKENHIKHEVLRNEQQQRKVTSEKCTCLRDFFIMLKL